MSPMEQLAKQEYERGYSDGKSDYFAASGKPIDHIANAGKMIGCAYCDNPLFAGTKCNNCGRVTLAEPVKQELNWGANKFMPHEQPVKQEPVALEEIRRIVAEYIEPNSQVDSGNLFWALCGALQYIDANLKFNVPTHPIRTKDLTDGELTAIWERNAGDWLACFRAVIAADREKNRG